MVSRRFFCPRAHSMHSQLHAPGRIRSFYSRRTMRPTRSLIWSYLPACFSRIHCIVFACATSRKKTVVAFSRASQRSCFRRLRRMFSVTRHCIFRARRRLQYNRTLSTNSTPICQFDENETSLETGCPCVPRASEQEPVVGRTWRLGVTLASPETRRVAVRPCARRILVAAPMRGRLRAS